MTGTTQVKQLTESHWLSLQNALLFGVDEQ